MFKNRFGQIIYEDILHFFNNKSQNLTSSEIISKARNIAIDIIQEKINLSNDNPNKPLLVEALKKASKVKPSEEVVWLVELMATKSLLQLQVIKPLQMINQDF